MSKIFICNIDDLSQNDEGAKKVTTEFIKRSVGKKYILTRSTDKSFEIPKENLKIVGMAFDFRSAHDPISMVKYFVYIFRTLIFVKNHHPEELYYIPFIYSNPFSQIHAYLLYIINKSFKEILFHKPNVNIIFKIFSRFPIGVTSRDIELWLRDKGFNSFHIQVPCERPSKGYLKKNLRNKYGFNESDFIILHVGHATSSRGLDVLFKLAYHLPDNYRILIILSSLHEKMNSILKQSVTNERIKIIDQYLEDIYEVYAISDVYVFPIKDSLSAIDVPLSILEANEFNLPIISSNVGYIEKIFKEYSIKNFYLIEVDETQKMADDVMKIIKKIMTKG